ncbi:IS21-like element helper ATPase IstB [Alicyclobacillus tolerans]|uniref:IS21-like element helper ATPase IstB n=1 Tax=Alicyclobacillus tolerans TaxID=90970 RepID=UPI001F0298FF|nr:IS21-like element helper ATPase IstB [Alicyclobacillus tolerans]MCF8567769.1 IS21-like element helper ATPase IstB [Alicyclobacillus tolerans]
MLNNQTAQALREMRLSGMADAYEHQLQNPHLVELSFEERFGMLVDAESTMRQNHRLSRLLREAHLKVRANPEDIDFHQARGIDQGLLRDLTTCQWVTAHHHLILTGPTGIGKTFIACALGTAACRMGLRVRYHRLSRLLQDIFIAKADGSYPKLVRTFLKVDLLILDDWGLAAMSAPESRDLLDLVDDRFGTHSTCVISQIPVEHWHQQFADATVADAILDRLVHNAYRINLRGESMRKITNSLPKSE